MLSKNKYSFKKFDLSDKKNIFTVYGDNVTESAQIIEWLYELSLIHISEPTRPY